MGKEKRRGDQDGKVVPFKLSQGLGMYTMMHSRAMTLNEEDLRVT